MNRYWRDLDPRYYAAGASLLLSALAVAVGLTPNPDGYTYMRTAEIFQQEGLLAAFSHYHWAGYPILIALVQYLPGVEMVTAAHLVNAALYVLVTASFMTLVREVNPSRRVALIAAVTILVYPHINEFRFTIIRDIGFLGFSLLGLLYLIRYYRDSAWSHAAAFCATLAAATLFRAEGLVLLAFTPFCLFLDTERGWRRRLKRLGLVLGLAGALALTIFIAFLLAGVNPAGLLLDWGRLYLPFVEQSGQTLFGDAPELTQAIFTEHAALYSERYTALLLLTGLTAILITKFLESVGTPYLMVLGWGAWKRNVSLPRHVLFPALFYLLAAFLIPLAFILVTRFTTTRYTMLFCTTLVLAIPLIIERAWQSAERHGGMRRFAWIVILLAVYCAFDSHVMFGGRKTYMPETLEWIEQNTPDSAALRTNIEYFAWATGKVEEYDRITPQISRSWLEQSPPGSTVVIENRGAYTEILESAVEDGLLEPLRQVSDGDRERIFIYRATEPDSSP